ncbi:hypothetical protein PAPYR_3586 [Paratrimastix pyriformis]|uniref:Uncharacterized protein n=1 Tax=Paratrimastix pyriformis TaxID=342808 RepID=A0ABQ8ULZ1_9EUKA|nr:hypothetical protein PAPYR_3586 [Paratrimastix pyriformis]
MRFRLLLFLLAASVLAATPRTSFLQGLLARSSNTYGGAPSAPLSSQPQASTSYSVPSTFVPAPVKTTPTPPNPANSRFPIPTTTQVPTAQPVVTPPQPTPTPQPTTTPPVLPLPSTIPVVTSPPATTLPASPSSNKPEIKPEAKPSETKPVVTSNQPETKPGNEAAKKTTPLCAEIERTPLITPKIEDAAVVIALNGATVSYDVPAPLVAENKIGCAKILTPLAVSDKASLYFYPVEKAAEITPFMSFSADESSPIPASCRLPTYLQNQLVEVATGAQANSSPLKGVVRCCPMKLRDRDIEPNYACLFDSDTHLLLTVLKEAPPQIELLGKVVPPPALDATSGKVVTPTDLAARFKAPELSCGSLCCSKKSPVELALLANPLAGQPIEACFKGTGLKDAAHYGLMHPVRNLKWRAHFDLLLDEPKLETSKLQGELRLSAVVSSALPSHQDRASMPISIKPKNVQFITDYLNFPADPYGPIYRDESKAAVGGAASAGQMFATMGHVSQHQLFAPLQPLSIPATGTVSTVLRLFPKVRVTRTLVCDADQAGYGYTSAAAPKIHPKILLTIPNTMDNLRESLYLPASETNVYMMSSLNSKQPAPVFLGQARVDTAVSAGQNMELMLAEDSTVTCQKTLEYSTTSDLEEDMQFRVTCWKGPVGERATVIAQPAAPVRALSARPLNKPLMAEYDEQPDVYVMSTADLEVQPKPTLMMAPATVTATPITYTAQDGVRPAPVMMTTTATGPVATQYMTAEQLDAQKAAAVSTGVATSTVPTRLVNAANGTPLPTERVYATAVQPQVIGGSGMVYATTTKPAVAGADQMYTAVMPGGATATMPVKDEVYTTAVPKGEVYTTAMPVEGEVYTTAMPGGATTAMPVPVKGEAYTTGGMSGGATTTMYPGGAPVSGEMPTQWPDDGMMHTMSGQEGKPEDLVRTEDDTREWIIIRDTFNTLNWHSSPLTLLEHTSSVRSYRMEGVRAQWELPITKLAVRLFIQLRLRSVFSVLPQDGTMGVELRYRLFFGLKKLVEQTKPAEPIPEVSPPAKMPPKEPIYDEKGNPIDGSVGLEEPSSPEEDAAAQAKPPPQGIWYNPEEEPVEGRYY